MPTTYAPGYAPTRPMRPETPDEAAKGALYKQAWDYAQQFQKGDQPAASMTWLTQHDPTFQIPTGYKKNDDGTVEVDRGSWLARNWSYLALAAVTGGIGLSLLPPAAAVGAVPGVTVAPASSGAAATSAGASAAGAGAAAAGAGTGAVAPVAGTSAIPWGTIFNTGMDLFGHLFAANTQANSADTAAATIAASQKYSADLISKANADALKFQYANSENAYQNNEAARQGNYGLFAARERRLGTIGDEVGLGPREIPAYVPGVDPHFGSIGDAAAGTGAPTASAGGNPSDPNAIMAALTDNYKKLGVAPTGPGSGPTDIAYMAKQMAATGGLAPNNASYWLGPQGRIAQELAKAGGGGSMTTQPQARTAAPATTATPFMPPTMAAGVPQAIGYYA